MIPRIIHYCWFGRGEMPEREKRYLESWRQVMPDWTYMLWNEDNFDVERWAYTLEAYQAKKYAFVSDVARLWALYSVGGVYMDTDVEVFRSYDDLLHLTGFVGYEGSKTKPIGTGTIAAEKGNAWVKEQLDSYTEAHFINHDGSLNQLTNPLRISAIMKENGFICDGRESVYKDMHIFPSDYFCPRQTTGELLFSSNTYCDHHFIGSWNCERNKNGKYGYVKRIVGQTNFTRLIKLKRLIFG